MKNYKLTIPGIPVSQGRPRFARRGNFTTTYDPPKSKAYKQVIKEAVINNEQKVDIFDGQIAITINVYRPIQKSITKAEYALRYSNKHRPIVKPDLDNYIKIVLDGLNGILWVDDAHIIKITAGKYYSDDPCVMVEVDEI